MSKIKKVVVKNLAERFKVSISPLGLEFRLKDNLTGFEYPFYLNDGTSYNLQIDESLKGRLMMRADMSGRNTMGVFDGETILIGKV